MPPQLWGDCQRFYRPSSLKYLAQLDPSLVGSLDLRVDQNRSLLPAGMLDPVNKRPIYTT